MTKPWKLPRPGGFAPLGDGCLPAQAQPAPLKLVLPLGDGAGEGEQQGDAPPGGPAPDLGQGGGACTTVTGPLAPPFRCGEVEGRRR